MDVRVLAAKQVAYCLEILRFRKVLNLTSIASMAGLMERFIEPSVGLQSWIPEGSLLLDIGSGMGVPGIPLLTARPDTRGVLVERRMKRAEFLRHVVRKLDVDCTVHCCDARHVRLPVSADVVIARAVAHPAALLSMAAPLVRKGGLALLPTAQEGVLVAVDGWCAMEMTELQFAGDEQQRVLHYRRL